MLFLQLAGKGIYIFITLLDCSFLIASILCLIPLTHLCLLFNNVFEDTIRQRDECVRVCWGIRLVEAVDVSESSFLYIPPSIFPSVTILRFCVGVITQVCHMAFFSDDIGLCVFLCPSLQS